MLAVGFGQCNDHVNIFRKAVDNAAANRFDCLLCPLAFRLLVRRRFSAVAGQKNLLAAEWAAALLGNLSGEFANSFPPCALPFSDEAGEHDETERENQDQPGPNEGFAVDALAAEKKADGTRHEKQQDRDENQVCHLQIVRSEFPGV